MNRSGIATFTLDYGKCPKWLFERMVKLGREMVRVIAYEYGPDEFVKRMADPVWFQSLGTVLAFDWNASGLTTILTAALKEAIRGEEKNLGIFICGGKGKTSKKVPDEIFGWGNRVGLEDSKARSLVYDSKMAAKVDSSLIQDGFQIYHHSFMFSRSGVWTVVQQGMNVGTQTARRYHWHSDNVKDFVREPHTAIISEKKKKSVLNLTSKDSDKAREVSSELVASGYKNLFKDIQILRENSSQLHKTMLLKLNSPYDNEHRLKLLKLENTEFKNHPVELEDFNKSKYLEKILWTVCDQKPENYEKLLAMKGVGPKTMRALALVSEIIYGAGVSYEDPARYSFAHGGKDATPYPVDRITYDKTIKTMQELVSKSRISPLEKKKIVNKLNI